MSSLIYNANTKELTEAMEAILMQASAQPSNPTVKNQHAGYEGFLFLGVLLGAILVSTRSRRRSEASQTRQSTNTETSGSTQETSYSTSVLSPYSITPPNFLEENSFSPSTMTEENHQESNDYQWIARVLKLPFRILSGSQGSGKSTLERFMIHELKQEGWHVICINLETNPDLWQGVEVISVSSEASLFFSNFIDWVAKRQEEVRKLGLDEDDYYDIAKSRAGRDGLVAIFLMETNTYEVRGVNPQHWAGFLQQCLTNIRKWGFTACFTAHSDNQTSVASELKGFSKLLDSQPRIECIAKTDADTGVATSSGQGLLKMEGVKDKNAEVIKLKDFPKTKDFRTEADKLAPPKVTDNSPPLPAKSKEEYESTEFLDMVCSACRGKGLVKVSRLPTESKPVRNLLLKKFGKQDLDDIRQLQLLHIILGILEYQNKVKLIGERDEKGLIKLSKDNQLEIIE